MVGRLVQQQDIRLLHQRARQRRPPQLTARKRIQLVIHIKAQRLDHHLDFIGLVPLLGPLRQTLEYKIHDALVRRLHMLAHITRSDAWQGPARSVIQFAFSCNQVHKRGLARAVLADESDLASRMDMKGQAFEKGLSAKDDNGVFNTENKIGHGGGFSRTGAFVQRRIARPDREKEGNSSVYITLQLPLNPWRKFQGRERPIKNAPQKFKVKAQTNRS